MISYKKKKYRLFFALIILAIGVYGSVYQKIGDDYIEKIQKLRANYNQYIKYYEDSPLEQDELTNFEKLDYYNVNEQFKIKAHYSKLEYQDTFNIKLTEEKSLQFIKDGIAKFSFKGRPQKLVLLKHINSKNNRLFIPFKDKTSGKYTYGAGRYLDVTDDGSGIIIIDFNLAYNPYCAYNSNYKCPMVPSENVLKEEILAGEKSYRHVAIDQASL